MSLISIARAEVTNLLTHLEIPVHSTAPSSLVAPCVLLGEATPFVEQDTYQSLTAQFNAVIVARPGSNQHVITQLDDLVSAALIEDPSITVESYQTLTHAGQEYLTATLTITHPINL